MFGCNVRRGRTMLESSVVVPGVAGVVLTLTGAGTVGGVLSVLTAGQGGQRVRVFLPLEHAGSAPLIFPH